jgi:hypothetical protein
LGSILHQIGQEEIITEEDKSRYCQVKPICEKIIQIMNTFIKIELIDVYPTSSMNSLIYNASPSSLKEILSNYSLSDILKIALDKSEKQNPKKGGNRFSIQNINQHFSLKQLQQLCATYQLKNYSKYNKLDLIKFMKKS